MGTMFEVREYVEDDRSPFGDWFDGLDPQTAARVDRHIRRMETGNFGDSKPVQDGVHELRMDFGPGFRVYYGRDGKVLVVLLGGGTKRRQTADIQAAVERWKRYKATR